MDNQKHTHYHSGSTNVTVTENRAVTDESSNEAKIIRYDENSVLIEITLEQENTDARV